MVDDRRVFVLENRVVPRLFTYLHPIQYKSANFRFA